ncbi:uncharacterized protein LOC118414675 [Branchiostoma floridae]|uniref:Uncharacterized protein LOC118414675 n=1 Tax=Branchiostoma floridae TaxID=7739 RepID=A0A9J7MPF2_BRAFL|nr:uncharacterized protein LOC118414675 [Branchiostoma floridae]
MLGVAMYAVGIVLLPSMVDITGAITSHQVANQTANSTDFTLNFTADSAYLSVSPPVTESPTVRSSSASPLYDAAATTELNTTVASPVTGQCRLAGHRRRTSQHPASEVPARVWGPLLSVLVVMEQGKNLAYLASIVMVGNAGVVSNILLTVVFS